MSVRRRCDTRERGAEDVNPFDTPDPRRGGWDVGRRDRHVKVDAAVWPGRVVVAEIVGQDAFKVAAVADQDPVQALGPHGAYPAFGVGVGFRRPRRSLEHLDAGGGEHRIERGSELAVTIPDQKTEPVGVLVELHHQVTGRLGDPGASGVGGDTGQVHPAVVKFDDKEYMESGQADRFDGQEVAGERPGGLGAQELGPGRPAAAWRWSQAVAAQDGAYRGCRHPHAELAALADDAQVPPPRVLSRQTQHEVDDFGVQPPPAASTGRVGRPSTDQLPMPAKQGRRGDQEDGPAIAGE
jgi:hypothetical protein